MAEGLPRRPAEPPPTKMDLRMAQRKAQAEADQAKPENIAAREERAKRFGIPGYRKGGMVRSNRDYGK